ncbi:MAG: CopG family transcriptional regulator [Firmicutes bacterium]|nr:CopG family transcriptional regulator [Bacillota bacterium]
MINRRVVVIMPDTLLKAVDEVAFQEYGSRSAFIREALKYLLEKRLLEERREKMAEGYQKMARLNQELAEEGLADAAGIMEKYLQSLVSGGK